MRNEKGSAGGLLDGFHLWMLMWFWSICIVFIRNDLQSTSIFLELFFCLFLACGDTDLLGKESKVLSLNTQWLASEDVTTIHGIIALEHDNCLSVNLLCTSMNMQSSQAATLVTPCLCLKHSNLQKHHLEHNYVSVIPKAKGDRVVVCPSHAHVWYP